MIASLESEAAKNSSKQLDLTHLEWARLFLPRMTGLQDTDFMLADEELPKVKRAS